MDCMKAWLRPGLTIRNTRRTNFGWLGWGCKSWKLLSLSGMEELNIGTRRESLMLSASWETVGRICNSTGCGRELQHIRSDQRCTLTKRHDPAVDSSIRCWTPFGLQYSCTSMSGGGTLHASQWENLRAKKNETWVLTTVGGIQVNINTTNSRSPLGSSST